jgi:hypothetical protein
VGPELAGKYSCTNFNKLPRYPGEPRPTVAEEICAASGPLLGPNNVQAALVKVATAIRTGDYTVLADFLRTKWKGLPGTADALEHLLDHIVLADAGHVADGAVADKDGDVECLPNGEACAAFDPTWSTQDRIWVGETIDCSTLDAATTLDVFGQCQHFDTELLNGGAGGGFAVPITLVLCYDGPSTVTPTPAKVFESPDDPLGENFEEIEFFEGTVADDPPDCASALLGRGAGPSAGAGALAGQKGGGSNGVALQGGIGTRISSFSDWGFVDLESALIRGTISSEEGPLADADVSLFCSTPTFDVALAELSPVMTTTSGSDGSYEFDNGETHIFLPGDECFVSAFLDGFEGNQTDSFTVEKGLNADKDITLTALD